MKTVLASGLVVLLLGIVLYHPGMLGISDPPFTLYMGGTRVRGDDPLVVVLDSQEAAEAGVCFAPIAADGRGFYRELYFKEPGQFLPGHLAPSGEREISMSSFGDDASSASIAIAEGYWARIEMAVVVEDYAGALRAAPLAGLANAPIIFNGDGVRDFLKTNGVRSVISLDADVGRGYGVKAIATQQALWEFQLYIMDHLNLDTDYIFVAGTGDMASSAMIPYVSTASAQLAVHKRAIVAADNYTAPLAYSQALGYGIGSAGQGERGGDPPAFNETTKLEYQRVVNENAIRIDNHIDAAAETLASRGMNPEYLALAGGIDTLPMMYITNPIWYEDANDGNNGEEYVATDSYYGDLDIILDPAMNVVGGYIATGSPGAYDGNNYHYDSPELYTQQLAVGRLVATSALDVSALLVRSITWDLSPIRHSILSSRACGTASGGASEEQRIMFAGHGVLSTRPGIKGFWSVYDIMMSHSAGNPARITDANFVLYNGHGFPDGWFYSWVHANDYDNSPDSLRSEDILLLELQPSVFFSASCLCSAMDWPTIWNGSSDEKNYAELGNEMYFPLAALKAGAIAHIGNTEESWGSFLGGQTDGYGAFDMATEYFEELMNGESLGRAHSLAKEKFITSQSPGALPIWQTCFLVNVLYGEPSVVF